MNQDSRKQCRTLLKRLRKAMGVRMLSNDLTCFAILRLKAVPPYDFALTVHKPAGWSLLTPFEIFEKGVLWTAMRTPSGEVFGLKLKSIGTVGKPAISCELYSREELGASERRELSENHSMDAESQRGY